MHTQHFPKTVLFTSQRGQRDRGTAKVLLLVPPKQHGHTSPALPTSRTAPSAQPPNQTSLPESRSKWLRLTQISSWIQNGTDTGTGMVLHGRLPYPPPHISAATEPADRQLKHSQHRQTRRHFHSEGILH